MDVTADYFGGGGAAPRGGVDGAGLHRSFTPAARSGAAKVARLSAGVVPGGVSFEPPAKSAGSLSLHAAPADRNTAATGVALGRVIDVTA